MTRPSVPLGWGGRLGVNTVGANCQNRKCTNQVPIVCTLVLMDVAVSDVRANLASWIGAVRDGAEVVITDRGLPVARLVAIDSASTIERLTRQGVIGRPGSPSRPTVVGRARPKSRQPVSDIVGEQRR